MEASSPTSNGAWGHGPRWPSRPPPPALLLACYAWAASRRLGAGKWLRKFAIRVAALGAAAFVLYSLLVIAGGNVKSEEVRAEYSALHPLLRMGVSVFVLADADAVITDADRTPGVLRSARGSRPTSRHCTSARDDGFVHALDLRTINRPEWRNLAAELAFRAMGFHTLRHVGTARPSACVVEVAGLSAGVRVLTGSSSVARLRRSRSAECAIGAGVERRRVIPGAIVLRAGWYAVSDEVQDFELMSEGHSYFVHNAYLMRE